MGQNRLNNMILSNKRRDILYQAIITDLALTGTMDRDDAEELLGYKIPDFLHTPDGTNINGDNLLEKKAEKKLLDDLKQEE